MESFIDSSVGKKYLMAITGLVWAGFVFAHMAGNFLIFLGPEAYNSYGHALTSGKLIYLIEGLLIFCLLVHVYCAVTLTLDNRKARGQNYAVVAKGKKAVTLASRTMAFQGSIVLFFIITHIINFKLGDFKETEVDKIKMRDLFWLISEKFHDPIYVGGYIIALCILGIHLSHGIGSLFQSFGVLSKSSQGMVKKVSLCYAIIVAGGFIIQPLYVYFFIN